MKKSKRLLGIAAAGLIGAGSLFSGVAVTGMLQQAEVSAATDVAINATNFPDANFRGFILDYIDSDNNKKLSGSEISKITDLQNYLYYVDQTIHDSRLSKVKDWKGLEYFTALERFSGTVSELNSLSDSVLGRLKEVTVSSYEKKIDLSKCKKLESLCIGTVKGEINIDSSTASRVKKLFLYPDRSVSKIDLSSFKNLEILDAQGYFSSLNLSKNTKLKHLSLNDGVPNLKTLDVSGLMGLESITGIGCEKLVMSKGQSFRDGRLAYYGQWSSANSKIVSVNKTGEIIKAENKGTTVITAKYGKKITVEVIDKTATKNGWKNENGGWKYYKDGKAYTGWHKMGKAEGEKTEHWSYFGKDGKIYTGWRKMGKNEGEKTEHWSYFGDNGWLRTGWQSMGKGTKNPDGNAAKHVSYFGDNGWLRTGWQQMGKGTKNPDGNAAKHWSYFGDNGWLRTGWQQMGKGTKNPDGNTAKHWSYFGANGWLRTGMVTLGKADGEKITHKSYFGNNGWLVTNKRFSVAGRTYTADGRGWVK